MISKKEEMIKSVEDTEFFFDNLEQKYREEEYNIAQLMVKTEIHPSGAMLYDLFNGTLDEDTADNIQNHLFVCRKCLDEFARIMRIENELEAEAMEWIDTESFSLLEFIKGLLVPDTVGLECMGLTHRGAKDAKTEDTDDYPVPTPISHIARREGEYITLLEESDDNSVNTIKLIQFIEKVNESKVPKHILQTAVLGSKDAKWEKIKTIKGMNLPVKIQDKDIQYDQFIILMGPSSKVEKSVKFIINTLNDKKSEKKLKDVIIVVITKTEGDNK